MATQSHVLHSPVELKTKFRQGEYFPLLPLAHITWHRNIATTSAECTSLTLALHLEGRVDSAGAAMIEKHCDTTHKLTGSCHPSICVGKSCSSVLAGLLRFYVEFGLQRKWLCMILPNQIDSGITFHQEQDWGCRMARRPSAQAAQKDFVSASVGLKPAEKTGDETWGKRAEWIM